MRSPLQAANPDVFQLGVQCWYDGDDTVLWHPVTGRAVRLHHQTLEAVVQRPDDPRLAPVRRRLEDHHLLRASARPSWPDLIPCRSRLVLLLVDEATLWLPVPGFRGPGGYGYRAVQLSPRAHQVWQAINDSRSVAAIAQRTGLPLLDVQAACAFLTTPELQALQLRDRPPHPRDLSLERLVDVPRPPNARPEHLHGPVGETTLTWYHLHEITDGDTHFDDRETTVAHSLALPHPALQGRAYGQALRQGLAARGLLPASGCIVELGCGTGELAAAWQREGPGAHYLRVDLSPELLRTQARNAPGTDGVLADGVALPLRDDSVDLLISNEVLADLSSVPVDPEHADDGPAALALAWARAAGLPEPEHATLMNLGSWNFVREIARVLRPGGAAWLSEFGVLEGDPTEAVQLDHPEVAIQFDHLARIARAEGLQADLAPMADVLGVDLHATQLGRSSWHALRALARSRDLHLPARAWTPQQLAQVLPFQVQGLRWVPLSDEGPGPLITRFHALTLHKPQAP